MLSDCTLETGVNMSAMYVGACPIDALWTHTYNQAIQGSLNARLKNLVILSIYSSQTLKTVAVFETIISVLTVVN